MNTTVWVIQGLLAFVFIVSGIYKSYYNEKTLVQKGQTGVEGFSPLFIKFIGFSEIIGATALILPMLINWNTFLTPIAAVCLGLIMILAATIHFKRNEIKNVVLNFVILCLCGLVAYYRAT